MWVILCSAQAMVPAMDDDLAVASYTWGFGPDVGEELPTGDFDGDGFDDLVVPRPNAQGYGLAVHPGSAAGVSPGPAWTDRWGIRAVALDADGDGFDDLVVQGGVRLSLYFGSVAGLSAAPASTANSYADGLAAGDLNGDGFADLITRWDDTYVGYGVEVWWLGPGGLPAVPDWSRSSVGWLAAPLALAVAVSDLNGDGIGDLALGNPRLPVGEIEVHLGDPTGLSARPDWTIDGQRLLGRGPTEFGAELAGSVDLDGDGNQDLGVTYRESNGAARFARVLGGAGGPRLVDGPPIRHGWYVHLAPCRDIDGDGRDELIVGWPFADTGGIDRGAAAIVYAGAVPSLNREIGNSPGDYAGSSLGSGDFDGDGQVDWAMYAPISGVGLPGTIGVDYDPS